MARYLLHGSYSVEGVKGVIAKGGTARVEAVQALAAGVGGRIESFDFAFGKDDFYVIADLPSNTAAAAIAMAVGAAGGASVTTVVLLTAAEIDAAAKTSTTYRRPGG